MKAIHYAQELIRFESTSTLSNAPICDYVQQTLDRFGFETERIDYHDAAGVLKVNVVGKKGSGHGGMAYFGHTDVVPVNTWQLADHGPWEPTLKEGRLYGRGSCDMKGSVASMLAAAEQFPASRLQQPIYITCTADEEIGYGGAKQVAARSELFREMVNNDAKGVIGEPTQMDAVYAHKGTYGFRAIARGRAAHSSTRKGINANLAMIPYLVEMKKIHDETEADPNWRNDEFDPPWISWNIGINDHTHATNITAPQSICTVYFRPMPDQNPDVLIDRSRLEAEQCGLEFETMVSAPPFYLDPESAYLREVLTLANNETARTVSYGTDGAIFCELNRLVVLGPGDIAQAHTADEWISLEQLERGEQLYARLIEKWCC